MAMSGKCGERRAASVSIGREAFLAARAQSGPAIEEAKTRLAGRLQAVCRDAHPAFLGTFALLYESEDGRLCLFQSEDGHLAAVDSSKLA